MNEDAGSDSRIDVTLSRRKALAALGVVGAAGAGAGYGTSALFSDEESFVNNSLTAGTLGMSVTAEIIEANQYWVDQGVLDDASATADGDPVVGLQAEDVKPGDWVIICFEITVEDNPGYVQISTANFKQYENGQTEPEIDADGDDGSAGGVNSVDTQDGTVALAVEADSLSADGRVAFYEATRDNSFLGSAPLGPLPDLVKFAPDGDTVLVANEGEPSDDYSTDPEGSVSVVDVSSGFGSASEAKADFTGFDAATLRSKGVRIFGPGASAEQDLEPESVVASPDSQTAFVSLQENNAIAIMDISDTSNPTVEKVVPLGYKDHSLPGNELDAIDDGNVDIRNEPLFGTYQPDVLETAEIDGETYLVTAGEGDTREYEPGLFETGMGGAVKTRCPLISTRVWLTASTPYGFRGTVSPIRSRSPGGSVTANRMWTISPGRSSALALRPLSSRETNSDRKLTTSRRFCYRTKAGTGKTEKTGRTNRGHRRPV